MSPMNSHIKTIFWVHLYQLEEFCVPGDLNNKCTVSLLQCYWWMAISRPSYEYNSIDSMSLETCKVSSPMSPTSGSYKTIFWVQLYWHCVPGDMQNFPSVTYKWLFQDHLLSTTLLTQRALCSEICRMSSQCHLWIVISRPSSEDKSTGT